MKHFADDLCLLLSAFGRQNIPPTSVQLSSAQAAQLSPEPPAQRSSAQLSSAQLRPAQLSAAHLISKNQESTQPPGNDHFTYETVCWPSRFSSEHILTFLSVSKPIHDSSAQLCSAQRGTAQLSTAQLSLAQRSSAQLNAARPSCMPSRLSDFLPAKVLQILTRSTMAEPRSACY